MEQQQYRPHQRTPVVETPKVQSNPLVWMQAAPPELRPDGSKLERYVSNTNKSTRELLRAPQSDAAVLLFGGAHGSNRSWNGTAQPTQEREVHPEYRMLIVRDPQRSVQWRQDGPGTAIVETPLTVNPIFGAPRRRTIERYDVANPSQENSEWTRLNAALGTSL
jgi:hypothetical protein